MSKVFTSSVIPAPIGKVWARIRDFNALPDWHPAVADSKIEDDKSSDFIGCIRNFNLKNDGGNIRERLLALDDNEYYCTYCILESPMNVEIYVATMSLLPITDGNRTYAEWTADFECDPKEESELVDFISNSVFQGGFSALNDLFTG